jgi:hypothetical protein
MQVGELLRRTAARYQKARRLVLEEHPNASESEFSELVKVTVQRLADQEKHLESHAPEQSTISPTAKATHRRPQPTPGRRSPTP